MNIIKRLLVAILLFIVPLCVFAKQSIAGTDIIDVNIPENWKLFTKENIEDLLIYLNVDKNQKANYEYNWRKDYYYFDIEKDTKDKKIVLIKKISDFEIDDLSIYMDEDIINTFDEVKNNYENIDVKISLYTTVNGIKYYKIQYKNEANNLNITEYITTIHGEMYKYQLQDANETTNEVEKEAQSIINSIEYDNYLEFVKNNEITNEPKKSNSSAIIIVIVLIIGIGVGIYLFLMKKKKNLKVNDQTYIATPLTKNPANPAVADFISQGSNQQQDIKSKDVNSSKNNDETKNTDK